jgi:signal transduction histidine kinase
VRAGTLRLVLVLDVAAIAATAAALLLGVGLPAASAGALGPVVLVALAAGVALAAAAVGIPLLLRSVGAPVDRILAAARALRAGAGELPVAGDPADGGHGLARAAVAFERVGAALGAERERLAEKVRELERANAELVRARESLVRAERLATLGRIASGVAHEVGNPLGAIGGYVELARERLAASHDGARDEARRRAEWQDADEFLARVAAEAARIDRIVRDLLDLGRPAEAAPGAVDIAAPLDAALRLARVQERFRGVEVELALAADLPRAVADERRLSQVFLNLLLNAGDAMSGAGRVRVAARAAGGRVVVEVADGGPGIPSADLPRVFEPFFTTKAAGRGTGLGLAISQGIVEAFGGELAAANAPGGGAVFTVALRAAA